MAKRIDSRYFKILIDANVLDRLGDGHAYLKRRVRCKVSPAERGSDRRQT